MGNICAGGKTEEQKPDLFEATRDSDANVNPVDIGSQAAGSLDRVGDAVGGAADLTSQDATDNATIQEQQSKLESLRLEQARLDMIVQLAGRRMVAVRSARGSNAYYDQGFAAAFSQHLEQTTKFQEHVQLALPEPHPSSAFERLSQPAWSGIHMGDKDGVAGLAGENPHSFFDRMAESVVEELVPKKERIFDGVEPMVESLL